MGLAAKTRGGNGMGYGGGGGAVNAVVGGMEATGVRGFPLIFIHSKSIYSCPLSPFPDPANAIARRQYPRKLESPHAKVRCNS